MPMDRFLIAPYDQQSGQQTNIRPWLIPDEAFQELNNAYVFRGRVRKRFGTRWFQDSPLTSRLRVALTPTMLTVTTPQNIAIGQQFSIGTSIFTVTSISFPVALLTTSGVTAQLVAADQVTFSAIAATVYWYPALPVMGLLTFEDNVVNDEPIIGFDTSYAYQYNNGWERLATESTAGAATWTGSNSQFFWAETWTGTNGSDKVFFVTNFNENEPNFMRSYIAGSWDNFRPQVSATDYLNSALLLVVFKNRLLAFNTWESVIGSPPGTNYPNRCRYSQFGSPLASDAWRQDIAGRGNAIDAATTEAIVTCEFIKDRLIVFFERSTWELVYTGNQAYPFTWQKINTELGAESTFSIVPFDKVALGVGNVGVMACNGTNTERIDEKIPDSVFEIHNTDDGIFRVYGIRDYFVEMVYWTFPSVDSTSTFPFPNRILVYNYKTDTWAFNDDSITCFGYFQPTSGITWDSETVTWDDAISWDSGSVQAKFRQVVGGNQQGYTFICDSEHPTNAPLIQITQLAIAADIVTVTAFNHNFREGEFIYLDGIVGTGTLTNLNGVIFKITNIVSANQFTFITDVPAAGTYQGGGLIARVSNISIKTKEYNFYAKNGRNAYVQKVDFMVDKTDTGQIEVSFFVSTSVAPLLQDGIGNEVVLGTGTLDTFAYTPDNSAVAYNYESTSSRIWHPVYFQADGEVVQLQLKMNEQQMRNTEVRDSDFQLHAMCIFASPTSSRLQ